MKKGFSGSSPQPVQLELAIARTFSMLYLLTIYYRGGVPPQQLDPTYQQTLVLLTLQPVLLRTIMKELEGLLPIENDPLI